MPKHKAKHKDWITAGGLLGLAILAARATRTPLATLLAAMPQLLRIMQSYERSRAYTSQNNTPPQALLTREEAALILGVSVNATPEQVREAHRRLIQKNHPDLGGTDYLASKINHARDTLLK
ncbi:MAG: hypothetical protein K2Q01_07980 [Rickettsiales bacterium]|nr:hypothetical protein [Rickettsiales bacterium]